MVSVTEQSNEYSISSVSLTCLLSMYVMLVPASPLVVQVAYHALRQSHQIPLYPGRD